MDVFISEDYINRRQEMKRQQKLRERQQLRVQTTHSTTANGAGSPATPAGTFSPASDSPAPAFKAPASTGGAALDDLYHCFTP